MIYVYHVAQVLIALVLCLDQNNCVPTILSFSFDYHIVVHVYKIICIDKLFSRCRLCSLADRHSNVCQLHWPQTKLERRVPAHNLSRCQWMALQWALLLQQPPTPVEQDLLDMVALSGKHTLMSLAVARVHQRLHAVTLELTRRGHRV